MEGRRSLITNIKLVPYLIGLLVLSFLTNGILTKVYLNKRDEVAQQIELCNVQKLEAITKAERAARAAQEAANVRHMEQLEAQRKRLTEALRLAQRDTVDARAERDVIQAKIRQIMRDARGNKDATISQICLDVDISDDALNSLR